jgi:hypothetical protein
VLALSSKWRVPSHEEDTRFLHEGVTRELTTTQPILVLHITADLSTPSTLPVDQDLGVYETKPVLRYTSRHSSSSDCNAFSWLVRINFTFHMQSLFTLHKRGRSTARAYCCATFSGFLTFPYNPCIGIPRFRASKGASKGPRHRVSQNQY